jgi:hypothetical protein
MRRIPAPPSRNAILTCLVILLGCLTVLAAAALLATLVAAAPAAAAPAAAAPAAAAGRSWSWPLEPPPEVLRGFAPPAVPWGAGHRGVDLAASPGQPVRTAGPGVVTYAGRLAGRGVVSVTHGAIRTTYEPVAPAVQIGQRVTRGAVLGRLEAAPGHCAGRACLHWGLLRGEEYLNPLSLLRRGPSRLLPIWRSATSVRQQSPGLRDREGSSPGSGGGSFAITQVPLGAAGAAGAAAATLAAFRRHRAGSPTRGP